MPDWIKEEELSKAVTALYAAKDAVRLLEGKPQRTVKEDEQLRYAKSLVRRRTLEVRNLMRKAQLKLF